MDTWNPQIIVHPLWCPKLLPSPLPTVGNYSHMRGEVMEGWWRGDGDDDDDDFPSPEAKTTSRLALPRKNRGWRRLHGVDQKSDFCSGISSRRVKIGGQLGHQGVWDHPRRPPDAARGWPRQQGAWAPLAALWPHFLLVEASGAWIFVNFLGIF